MSPEAKRLKRIESNQDIFQNATSEQQTLIKKGDIDIGFTEEMVLLSWGSPDYAFDRVTEEERSRVWKYTSQRRKSSWDHATVPVTYRDGKGRYRTTWSTVTVDSSHYQEYTVATIEFIDGKVKAFDVRSDEQPEL